MSREGRAATIAFSQQAWADYPYWVQHNRNVAGRIARLIEECLRDPFQVLGNPEPLKHEFSGYWSRRITKEHRLVYQVAGGQCVVIRPTHPPACAPPRADARFSSRSAPTVTHG